MRGELHPAVATLEAWKDVSAEAVETYGDVILGIYRNIAVSAFDITGWTWDDDGRITFRGTESRLWRHLIDMPNPGKRWVRGQARPVQYLDTQELERHAHAGNGVHLPDDLLALVDARAARQQVSREQVVREAIEAHLRDERAAAHGRAIIEGHQRIPPGAPDEWGDLEAWHDAAAAARAGDTESGEW